MTPTRTLPLLLLVACGGMKSVSVEALAEVSTASVVHLAAAQEEMEDAERALEDLTKRHDEVSRAAESADTSVTSAQTDLDQSKMNRGVAVSDGDVDTAQALAEDVDAAESTASRRRSRADQQLVMLDLMAQGLKVREAELDASRARLEMARAQAASDGGADVNLNKYTRQGEKYDKRVSQETSELRALEVSLDTVLAPAPARSEPAKAAPTTPEPAKLP